MCHINRHNSCARSCLQKTKFYVMVDLSVLVSLQYLKAVIIKGRPIHRNFYRKIKYVCCSWSIDQTNTQTVWCFGCICLCGKSKTCMHKTWVGHRKSFLQTSNVKASELVPVPGIQWGKKSFVFTTLVFEYWFCS